MSADAFKPGDPDRLAFDERDHVFLHEHAPKYGDPRDVTPDDASGYVDLVPVSPRIAIVAAMQSVEARAREIESLRQRVAARTAHLKAVAAATIAEVLASVGGASVDVPAPAAPNPYAKYLDDLLSDTE